MRIGIDANWAIYENAGIGKYTYNLVKALLSVDQSNQYTLFFNYFRKAKERRRFIHEMISGAKADVEIVVSPLPSAWREWLFQTPFPANVILNRPVDVYHAPFFAGMPKNGYTKSVLTVHDLVFMLFPEHRGKKLSDYYLKRTKNALSAADEVIAVSGSTKKDLVDLLEIDDKKIKVVYEGVNKSFKPVKDKKEIDLRLSKYLPPRTEYILSVCTLEPRKNLPRLVRAYSQLPNDLKRRYKLVLIGKQGWNNQEFSRTIDDFNLKSNVIMPGYVADEDLPAFYTAAAVFVYPSLYEGFGLPPLEAMACGTPVLTSNTSSLPEVVGDAGILVNPLKDEQISQAMKKILTDSKLADELKEKGLEQAKNFSWRKTARDTIKIYESLA